MKARSGSFLVGRGMIMIAILVVVSLLLSGSSLGAFSNWTQADGRKKDASYALVYVPSELAPNLRERGIDVVVEYDSFVLAKLDKEDENLLGDLGITYQKLKVGNAAVGVNDRGMDGQRKVLLDARSSDGIGHYVIQFVGPIKREWYNALVDAGLKVLGYLPFNSYLVTGDHDDIKSLGDNPYIMSIRRYTSGMKISPALDSLKGKAVLTVQIFDDESAKSTVAKIVKLGAIVRSCNSFDSLVDCKFEVDVKNARGIANLESVYWVEPYFAPTLNDEVADQIIAGNYINPTDNGPSGPGYLAYLNSIGINGSGAVVGVADTGLDNGNIPTIHQDLRGRVAYAIGYGSEATDPDDGDGHGTHVAGIIAGNAAIGTTDANGYKYGLGSAPGAQVGSQAIFSDAGDWVGPAYDVLTTDAMDRGAVISHNSWGCGAAYPSCRGEYNTDARSYDILTRDGDTNTAGNQEYIIIFSVGNDGTTGSNTVGTPATAKNVITVGASLNYRPTVPPVGTWPASRMNALVTFSSRGPTDEGRYKPDIVAPGTWIASLRSSQAAYPGGFWDPGSNDPNLDTTYHAYMGGTSQAAPIVSGMAALFYQYYKTFSGNVAPSPALVKAALINGAVDMPTVASPPSGSISTATIPNNNEGWGRANIKNTIKSGVNMLYLDQSVRFTTSGGTPFTQEVYMPDVTKPFKVSMVYTDDQAAAGCDNPPTSNCLVNNLDLDVIAPNGKIYNGNRFQNGWSVDTSVSTGNDTLNNVENVYIQSPTVGTYRIKVNPKTIAGDALNVGSPSQDFALVIYNGAYRIVVKPGLNEVSTPTIETTRSASSVATQLSNGDKLMRWNGGYAGSGTYKTFTVGTDSAGGPNDYAFDVDRGYFVNNTGVSDKVIYFTGILPGHLQRSVSLTAGMNIIGWTSFDATRKASNVFGYVAGATPKYILTWNATAQKYNPAYTSISPSSYDFGVKTGFGYWLFVTGASTLTYTA